MSKYVDKLPVVKSLKVKLKITLDRFKPYLKIMFARSKFLNQSNYCQDGGLDLESSRLKSKYFFALYNLTWVYFLC